jgi:mannose-1-phosphate guanylyltransferase
MSSSESAPTAALLLTAGIGTRLMPLTRVRAKPAVPVGGEPLIRRIIRHLVEHSVTRLVLNLHHLPSTIAAVVGDGSDLGAHVRYSWEQPAILGSAGGPRLALPLLQEARFLIVNGDTLSDLDVSALARAHAASGALVTLALTPNREPFKYGGVALDHDWRVTGFVPRGPAARGTYHFFGVQVVEARVFEPLQPGVAAASIGGVYDQLIARQPGSVRGFVASVTYWDVGTTLDYLHTSSRFGDDGSNGKRCEVDPTAVVERSILWDDVRVGARARLDRCIVTDRVSIAAGREFRDAVLIAQDGDVEVVPLPREASAI